MEYYYTPKELTDVEKKELTIDNFEFRHLTKVLRKRVGDNVTVTDGERNIYHCNIIRIGKDKLTCKIISHEYNLYEPEINITLYLSLLRNLSRFEFAIEKAVELGVAEIVPVITEFAVIKSSLSRSKTERINKIITGAMSQSQRCFLPKLHNTMSFNEMIQGSKNKKNKVVMYELAGPGSGFTYDKEIKEMSLLIGPEGGFSKNEISVLMQSSWKVKSLGERKLRAETAAIVSVFSLISELT